MLTRFIFGSALSSGFLVLGMPIVFGSLLSLRYPEQRISALNGHASRETALDRPSRRGSVIGPERLVSLRAARERRRAHWPSSESNEAA